MNFRKLDEFQYKHPVLAFPISVIKKYGDDQAGSYAALLTYYGFLSLFPLLLIVTTALQIVASSQPALQADIVNVITGNSSVLGEQLSDHILGIHRNGLALIVGVLFLLYGSRGVASAFRSGINNLFGVPLNRMQGFPQSLVKDLSTVIFGGLGFIVVAGITGTVAAVGNGYLPHILSYVAGILVSYLLLRFLISYVLADKVDIREIRLASIISAVGLVVMQIVGAYILAHVLKNLDVLYSYFAISLGLIFWIYLQAQVVYYAVEMSIVKRRRLWQTKIIN